MDGEDAVEFFKDFGKKFNGDLLIRWDQHFALEGGGSKTRSSRRGCSILREYEHSYREDSTLAGMPISLIQNRSRLEPPIERPFLLGCTRGGLLCQPDTAQ